MELKWFCFIKKIAIADDFYTPVGFPIFGTYDGNGFKYGKDLEEIRSQIGFKRRSF